MGAVPQTWSPHMASKRRKSADLLNTPTGKPAATKPERPEKTPARAAEAASASKQQRCLDLLARRGGASLADLVAATGWQPHSVRGFLSGTVKKKLGLVLASSRTADGARQYRIDRGPRGR